MFQFLIQFHDYAGRRKLSLRNRYHRGPPVNLRREREYKPILVLAWVAMLPRRNSVENRTPNLAPEKFPLGFLLAVLDATDDLN